MFRISGMTKGHRRSLMGGRLALAGLATVAAVAGLGVGPAAAQPSTVGDSSATQDVVAMAAIQFVSGGWTYDGCRAKGDRGMGRTWNYYECRAEGGTFALWVIYDCSICRTAPDGFKEGE
ncbi:hypothetical protein [Rhodococcus sp. OK302]|uniref:hypothetical protein n=1 Tax=Rhodococcus sp. OK302 TaxID=1882769 RepID=UPI000B9EF6D0|nr:hypothetical protein [Rhodococcus sp. OK302]OYD60795.1 hypothetical protein BDB13_5680 [Rhodococcus sp. OK302]